MREIKDPITQEEAEKLIGESVEILDSKGYVESTGFIVRDVDVESDGDIEFTTTGGRRLCWFTASDTLRVCSEPPETAPAPAPTETPREAVERLRSELKAAEDALASEGLPGDWMWGSYLSRSAYLAGSDENDSTVSATHYVGHGEGHMYIRVQDAVTRAPFDVIAAVVDRARAARAAKEAE